MLVDGVTVEYGAGDGAIRGAQARVVDFDDPDRNDWLAVNQLTVTENRNTRRPDVVLFVNGLPLGVIELKNPADEDATIWTAWQQLQTYKAELPSLFSMNEALMVSDGNEARVGDPHRRAGVVQALAHRHRRGPGRPAHDRAAGDAGGRLLARPVPRAGPGLHRLRGRRQRRPVQEDGRLSPAPRGARRGGRDAAGGGAAAACRGCGAVRVGEGSWAGSSATAASASCGTPRAPARA